MNRKKTGDSGAPSPSQRAEPGKTTAWGEDWNSGPGHFSLTTNKEEEYY